MGEEPWMEGMMDGRREGGRYISMSYVVADSSNSFKIASVCL